MISCKRALTLLISAALLACAAPVLLAQALPAPEPAEAEVVKLPPGVIASVNGAHITEQEWVSALKRVAGHDILGVMIRHQLIRQAAERRGIRVTDQELQAVFDRTVVQMGGQENLLRALEQSGESLPDYRERMKTEALLRRQVEESVKVGEEELQKFFLENYGRKAFVQVVIVGTQPEGDQVIQQARAGVDFSRLVYDYSADDDNRLSYGILPAPISDGFFPKPLGNVLITQPIAEEIFKVKEGALSGVIPAGQQGFYVFKVIRAHPAQPTRLETVRESLREEVFEMKLSHEVMQYLQKLYDAADIRVGITQ